MEVQAETEVAFGRRMFEYYALLWLEFDAPVFPIVLYLKGGGREGIDIAEYRQELFGREWVRFRYASVGLARLRAREYVETSPLGAALAALMLRGKASEELELRARMLNQVVSARLDEGRQYLLVNLIETYFELSAEERERFRQLTSRKEYREMQDVELTWGDRCGRKGSSRGSEKLSNGCSRPGSALCQNRYEVASTPFPPPKSSTGIWTVSSRRPRSRTSD